MRKIYWVVYKDLLSDARSCRIWPRAIGLGLSVAFLLAYQLSNPQAALAATVGGVCWITLAVASVLTVGEIFTAEQRNGCWDALRAYSISPASIFVAKMGTGVVGLGLLQLIAVPCLLWVSGVQVETPLGLLAVMLLGNVGLNAVGALVSGLTVSVPSGTGANGVLLMPLWVPVLLIATKATSLAIDGDASNELLRWLVFLGACDVVFITAGVTLFDFAIEE